MKKTYTVQKIHGLYSGPGWQSSSILVEEWAVVSEPFGIIVKTAKTEEEAIEYLNKKLEEVAQ